MLFEFKEEEEYAEESDEGEECDKEHYKEEEYNMNPGNNDWKRHDKLDEADINEDEVLFWNHDDKRREEEECEECEEYDMKDKYKENLEEKCYKIHSNGEYHETEE